MLAAQIVVEGNAALTFPKIVSAVFFSPFLSAQNILPPHVLDDRGELLAADRPVPSGVIRIVEMMEH